MNHTFNTFRVTLAVLLVVGLTCAPLMARMTDEQVGGRNGRLDAADPLATLDLIMHDVGNLRVTLSNFGVIGNPNSTPGFKGWEWPINSGNNFLFAAGIWVGAEHNGIHRVSTTVDGDNGTGEFYTEHIGGQWGTIPASNAPRHPDWFLSSKTFRNFNSLNYTLGIKAVDDDRDWNAATDDLDHNGKPSVNWDCGHGYLKFDDDGDGLVDEDSVVYVNGVCDNFDADGDGNVRDTGPIGDHLNDGNCDYDPEPHIDEDPAGDISHDRVDNDYDGLVDMADPNNDGDLNPGFLDDDNDLAEDEDGIARGTQEYYSVFQDSIAPADVRAIDTDGHIPLQIEMLQRSYAFPEQYAADFVFVDYVIRNVGPLPLKHVYISMFSDPDIGRAGETGDQASLHDGNYYDSTHVMMIQGKFGFWSGADTPGLFAIRVVKTPINLDKLKVTFANFERVSGGDPVDDVAKYNLISSGAIAPRSAAAGDWRMLLAFGDRENDGFQIDPDSSLSITVALISAATVADLNHNAESAYNMYLANFQGPASPDVPDQAIDVYGDFTRIRFGRNSIGSVDGFNGRHQFEGYIIERSTDQINWETLKSYDLIDRLDTIHVTLPDGRDSVYSDPARRFFEWQNLNYGMPRDSLQMAGDTTWWYTYEDHNLIPGHTYYYSVRAFSKGEVGAGILFSGRTGNVMTSLIARTAATGAPTSVDLKDVFVFPNPYKGSHGGEAGGQVNALKQLIEFPRKLYWMGLPANSVPGQCLIRIYSLGGDHLATLDHFNGTEYEQWDMNTKNQQEIVSGIYYYVVDYNGKQIINKFVVIK